MPAGETFCEVRHLEPGPAGMLETLLTWPGEGDARRGVVVFSPSPLLGGDMENNVTEALAREAARVGLAALRLNYRNTGSVESETGGLPRFEWWNDLEVRGDYAPVLEDARAAIAAARRLFEPVALLGYSFGAWVAWRTATPEGIGTCAAVCPPLGRLEFEGPAKPPRDALLVLAARDELDPAPAGIEVRRRFPEARVLRLEEAGHFLLDREEEVARSVLAFVADVEQARGDAA